MDEAYCTLENIGRFCELGKQQRTKITSRARSSLGKLAVLTTRRILGTAPFGPKHTVEASGH